MTWPTDRPGYPRDAERDGWHWLKHPEDLRPFPSVWNAELQGWPSGALHSPQGIVDLGFAYLGPCPTPADLDAAVQAEREAIAKWHDERKAYCDQRALEKIKGGDSSAADTPIIVGLAHEHSAAAIRARGPTTALDAALAQARRETWARAAEIAERVAIPEDCHGVEAHGRLMAAHAAADAIRSAAAGEEGKHD